ncbi:MAG: sigma-70 family RNA polymerase sigma factor, partial [Chloroflexi bacterium]
HQELHALLSQLPDDYQNVLAARFLSGLSPEEIAEMMGRSPGAVRVLQFRALRAIRKLMVNVEENHGQRNEE